MPKNRIQIAVRRLSQSGLASPSELCGCTNEEIANLESQSSVNLPSTFRTFLSLMGKRAGEFLVGTDWTFSQLPELKERAQGLLEECGLKTAVLPATAFVFAMHQGYQFLFFDSVAGDDPPVFLFLEGEDGPQQVFSSFSQWLLQCVDDEIEAYRESSG